MKRDFQLPGRSPVIAGEGMAATSHPLATLAALDVLRAGGNAADAAIAAVAVLCVVEPHMTGIGGDCFCLVAEPGKPVWGYNGSGRAGAAASTEALLAKGMTAIDATSPHAVTCRARSRPGARSSRRMAASDARPRCWRRRSATPSTAFRSRRASPRTGRAWSASSGRAPAPTKHYLFDGEAPAEGDVIKLPALAETLKAIAKNGPRAFYEGPSRRRHGGDVARQGLGAHGRGFRRAIAARRSTPISTNYRGLDLVRDSAERAGPHRAGDAQHPRDTSTSSKLDATGRRALPPDAGGGAARLRACATPTSPSRRSCASPVAALLDKAFAKKLAAQDRSQQARAAADRADARQRHGLSHRGRPRPQGGVVHQFAVFARSAPRICTEKTGVMLQQPRLRLRAQARSSERARSEQAADAHHHSGAWR